MTDIYKVYVLFDKGPLFIYLFIFSYINNTWYFLNIANFIAYILYLITFFFLAEFYLIMLLQLPCHFTSVMFS